MEIINVNDLFIVLLDVNDHPQFPDLISDKNALNKNTF